MKRIDHNELLMKLGAARKEAGIAWRLVDITVPGKDEPIHAETGIDSAKTPHRNAEPRSAGLRSGVFS